MLQPDSSGKQRVLNEITLHNLYMAMTVKLLKKANYRLLEKKKLKPHDIYILYMVYGTSYVNKKSKKYQSCGFFCQHGYGTSSTNHMSHMVILMAFAAHIADSNDIPECTMNQMWQDPGLTVTVSIAECHYLYLYMSTAPKILICIWKMGVV